MSITHRVDFLCVLFWSGLAITAPSDMGCAASTPKETEPAPPPATEGSSEKMQAPLPQRRKSEEIHGSKVQFTQGAKSTKELKQ